MNIRWLILLVLVSWVATCGQKGPLELPQGMAATNTELSAQLTAQLSAPHT